MSFLNVILLVNLFVALFKCLSIRKMYKQSEKYLEFERELQKKKMHFLDLDVLN